MAQKTIEYYKDYSEDAVRTMIAYANTDGGELLFGVNEDGSIVGVSNPAALQQKIQTLLQDGIVPELSSLSDCVIIQKTLHSIVAVRIRRGNDRPYYLKEAGMAGNGVFVRQANRTVLAEDAVVKELLQSNNKDNYENSRSMIQTLSFRTAERMLQKAEGTSIDEKTWRSCLLRKDQTYNLVALLLSEECPYTSKLAVFEGEETLIFRYRREFTGSILTQLKDILEVLDRYNQPNQQGKQAYAPQAIKEAICNALLHRDYSYESPMLIDLYDNRMEIRNMGGLVKGLSLKDTLLGVSVARNPKLLQLFGSFYPEMTNGIGIPSIYDSYAKYALKPRMEISEHVFKLTLPNRNSNKGIPTQPYPLELSEREQQVLELVKREERVTRLQVQEQFGISQATAIVLLRHLTEKKLLQKEQLKRQLFYRIR